MKNIHIINIRFSKNSINNSMPCHHCYKQILKLNERIHLLYFSVNNETMSCFFKDNIKNMNCNHISHGNRLKLGLHP